VEVIEKLCLYSRGLQVGVLLASYLLVGFVEGFVEEPSLQEMYTPHGEDPALALVKELCVQKCPCPPWGQSKGSS